MSDVSDLGSGSTPAGPNPTDQSPQAQVKSAGGEFNPLKLARAKARLTVRELASLSSVSSMTISFLENGQRLARFGTLYALAEALSIEVTELLPLLDPTPGKRGQKGGQARAKRLSEQPEQFATPSGKRKRSGQAKPSFYLVANQMQPTQATAGTQALAATGAELETSAHGPLTEASACKLAALLRIPSRVYEASSEREARALHLAWLTEITRRGQLDTYLAGKLAQQS